MENINENTRMQIELINQVLVELQVKNKGLVRKDRLGIGFIKPGSESLKIKFITIADVGMKTLKTQPDERSVPECL